MASLLSLAHGRPFLNGHNFDEHNSGRISPLVDEHSRYSSLLAERIDIYDFVARTPHLKAQTYSKREV